MAPMSGAVRDYQRRLAQLVSAHARAQARLEAAHAKRAEILAEHDRVVAEAEAALRQAVVDIAAAFGTETAADLVGMAPGDVRRLIRAGARR